MFLQEFFSTTKSMNLMLYFTHEVIKMAIGENIRKIRMSKGMTQKELGEKSGINPAQIRRYELGGKNSNPKLETLQKIATALEVSVADLDPRIFTDISSLEKKLDDLEKQRDNFIKSLSFDDFLKSGSAYENYTSQINDLYQQLKELKKNAERPKLYETTGEKIKKLRLKQGLTLMDMSAKTKIPTTLLYKIENNSRSVTIDTLVKISKYLNVAAIEIDANVALNWGFDIKTDGDKLHDQLLDTFERLNLTGQQKAVEQIEILSKIPEYQEQEPKEDDI